MDKIIIRGGKPLQGRIPISGAKNAALTLLPCALLTDEPLTLRNLPRLADVDSFGHLLNQLGVSTTVEGSRPDEFGRVMTMRAATLTSTTAPYDIVRKMRASIRAPIAIRHLAKSVISGSRAAFSITVVPLARTAAIRAFSVAPTETSGKLIVPPTRPPAGALAFT
jgi:UDP-N-acetylglucosamine 1-carboxyvinyltransferase